MNSATAQQEPGGDEATELRAGEAENHLDGGLMVSLYDKSNA